MRILKSEKTICDEAKSWQVKKLKDSVYGKDSLVKTWGIMSAENPMGKRNTANVNRDLRGQLIRAIKNLGLDSIPVKGKYGSDENSRFIINPTLKEMMDLSRRFNQESFIFATCKDGSCDAGYYEKGEGKNDPYILSISKNRICDMSDADDFFTSIKSHSKRAFKFQIPFFECANESIVYAIENYIMERYGYQGYDVLCEKINETFDPEISVRHRCVLRTEIYETKEEKVERYERNISSLKNILDKDTSAEDERDIHRMIESFNNKINKLISE